MVSVLNAKILAPQIWNMNFQQKIWQLPSEMRLKKQQETCQNSLRPNKRSAQLTLNL